MQVPGGSTMLERATDVAAILAVISGINPGIYQWMRDFSELGALMFPILGCAWLGVQIYYRVFKGK